MTLRVALLALLLAFAGGATAPRAELDRLADDYVRLQLAIGAQEEGYIDAYYGPPEWATAAKADRRSPAELRRAVVALRAALARHPGDARRIAFLDAQLAAADTRLRMIAGEKLRFAEEARGLFAVEVRPPPLASFDPVLAELDRLLPGQGDLAERLRRWREAEVVAPDRLEPVFARAIAECRARTLRHVALPADESFVMEFVTGKSWSGYNWYRGGYRSLIQINTDLPIRLARAVDLGCHEGYPGHHVLNLVAEQRLVRARGWREFAVYPLFSPQSLLAEGSANHGIDLAFPEAERGAFERRVLVPLAGLTLADSARRERIDALTERLEAAQVTIAQRYLDGEVARDAALALLRRYRLSEPARAEQQLRFIERYRSYVINYSLGRELVRGFVERRGPDRAARWRAFESLLGEPTLPRDLAP